MASEDMHHQQFVKRARERMRHMDQAAEDLRSAFSLSPETKYEIISLLERSEATDQTRVLDEEHTESETQNLAEPVSLKRSPTRTPSRKKLIWLRTPAAVLCVAFLVGAFALVLQTAHQNSNGIAHAPGLYVTTDNTVTRFASQNGHLTPLWHYTLSAPWTEQRIVEYGKQTQIPVTAWTTLIDSPVTVSGGVAYFGGNADDPGTHQLHHYLYALNASNGALLWRYQIDGGKSGIPSPFFIQNKNVSTYNLEPGTVTGAPQVTQDLVYILVASKPHGPEYNQYYFVFALDRKSGVVRWSTRYFADSSQMSVAPDGSMVYTTVANELMAFNGENGQQQWVKQVPRQNTYSGFFALQFANKTLYATLSYYGSTHTSLVYAFNAASGSQRWVSQPVDGMISPVVVDQNAVYFGSEAGHIYALRASDGSQLWNYSNGPFAAYVFLQKKDGMIYARVTESTYGRATEIVGGPPRLYLTVLDANSGTFERGTTIPQTHDNFGTAEGWDGGQLVVGNDILYTSMKNGVVCSLSIQNSSLIECDTLTHSALAPTLTLVENAAN